MEQRYSIERNVQMLIALLKANGIRKVIASPGTANMNFVVSLQSDPFFEIWSAPDERSAAYIACGMAEESQEPVVITCTGATASRNYLPALTEAFYRKIPILAVTGTLGQEYVGTLHPQVIDRTVAPRDTFCASFTAGRIKDGEDEWSCNLAINQAIVALLQHHQPVHLDLVTRPSNDFSVRELPAVRVIRTYAPGDALPALPTYGENSASASAAGKIILFIGSHSRWSDEEMTLVHQFCEATGALVLADHTANYNGLNGLSPSLLAFQKYTHTDLFNCDLLIHLGYVCGDYYTVGKIHPQQVWRVHEDGEIRDDFHRQTAIFKMKESDFFRHYLEEARQHPALGRESVNWQESYDRLASSWPELPFSNLWMMKQLGARLPEDSVLHLGILNSLRSANFMKFPASVRVYSNVGGFGIDGCLSTVMGAALAAPQKIFFCVIGDLAFFYDMNVLGNRHFPKNVRILLVNNGKGVEFTNYTHPASQLGADAEKFVAAGGHYASKETAAGNGTCKGTDSGQVSDLVRHYAEDLGLEYGRATSKEEFASQLSHLVDPSIGDRPLLIEAIVDSKDESAALHQLQFMEAPDKKDQLKNAIKDAIGEKAFHQIMKAVKN